MEMVAVFFKFQIGDRLGITQPFALKGPLQLFPMYIQSVQQEVMMGRQPRPVGSSHHEGCWREGPAVRLLGRSLGELLALRISRE